MATGTYRLDIDGLRALAVGLVVAFHIGLPGFDGGFVGVDMFFVASGYLITDILRSEFDQNGTIRFGEFWARRIRRLLPASMLALVVTVLLSWILLSPIALERITDTAVAVVLYVPNLFLGAEQGNYFAASTDENPLAHYWSLAVEEQFYLAWPIILFGLMKLGQRFKTELLVVAGLTLLAVVSLFHSEQLANSGSSWAYYSPLSRSWEFAVGGIAAFFVPLRGKAIGNVKISSTVGFLLTGAGLAILAASLLVIGERGFPGYRAIPGVAATTLILVGNSANHLASKLFSIWPAQFIGKVSYGWYLWHWPFIVLPRLYFGEVSGLMRLSMAGLSLLVAIVSYYLIEKPIRFAPTLRRLRWANYVLAAAATFSVFSVFRLADIENEEQLAAPVITELMAAQERGVATFEQGCGADSLDELRANDCVWGNPNASETVLLLGDSHAEQWLAGLDTVGERNNIAVIGRFLPACPVIPVGTGFSPKPIDCLQTQSNLVNFVAEVDPDLILVSQWSGSLETFSNDAWAGATREMLTNLEPLNPNILWIQDTPDLEFDPIECIARSSEADCIPAAPESLDLVERQNRIEEPIFEEFGVATFDPVPFLCDDQTCVLRYEGELVFFDDNHLSDTTSVNLSAQLEPELVAALAASQS